MLRTDDDEALLEAEHTSTIVMLVILVGLMFLPDTFFGCGEKPRGEPLSAPRHTSAAPR